MRGRRWTRLPSLAGRVDGCKPPTGIDWNQDYLDGKSQVGFCLGYRVQVVRKVNPSKPTDLRFNQLGWERVDRTQVSEWEASA